LNQSVSSGSVERPNPKVLLVWKLTNAIAFGIALSIAVLVALGFLLFAQRLPAVVWIVIVVLASLWGLSFLVSQKQWENWSFQVTPEALEMKQGWIWKHRRVVARDRIQHVDINSGPFDRKFGLVQVVVYTAGTTVGMIPGLDPLRAEALRDQLMAGRSVE
jgi:uncharacterized protein